MKEFLENLKQRIAENPPNYGDADSVLEGCVGANKFMFLGLVGAIN